MVENVEAKKQIDAAALKLNRATCVRHGGYFYLIDGCEDCWAENAKLHWSPVEKGGLIE